MAVAPSRAMRAVTLLAFATSLAAIGCGGVDDRPATLDYITVSILRPSCGLAACHAAETATAGYAFDTVDGARDALCDLVKPGNPDGSKLIDVLRDEQSMPPDSPMFDGDVALIERWIADDAEAICGP